MSATTLCIINFNGLSELKNAWQALSGIREQFAQILLIDNGSEDGSVAFARSLPGVEVVALNRNLGPAAARNLGFRLARYPRILFQDNDISLSPDTLPKLTKVLECHANALIASPRVCYRHHPDLIQYDSANCHVLGMMSLRHANVPVDAAPSVLARCTSLVTACFLIDRDRWFLRVRPEARLFDETLIFNFEDHDLGVRANLLGFDLYCESQATVLHGGGTEGQSWRPGYDIPAQRIFCLTRNRWWIIIRYFSFRSLVSLLPFLLMLEGLQFAGLLMKGFGWQWVRAVISTLRYLPQLYRQRVKFQSQRVRSDREFLQPGPLPLTTAFTSHPRVAALLSRFDQALLAWCRMCGWPHVSVQRPQEPS